MVAYTSYRLVATSDFSNITVQSIPNQTYIATPWVLALDLIQVGLVRVGHPCFLF